MLHPAAIAAYVASVQGRRLWTRQAPARQSQDAATAQAVAA